MGDSVFYVINEDEAFQTDDVNTSDYLVGIIDDSDADNVIKKLGINKMLVNISNKNEGNYYTESFDDFLYASINIPYQSKARLKCIIFKTKLIVIVNTKLYADVISQFLKKAPMFNSSLEKLIFFLFDSLFEKDNSENENIQTRISKMEKMVENDKTKKNFNLSLLSIKNRLVSMRNYYESIIDVSEYLSDDYIEIFDKKNIKHFKFIKNRAQRLKENIDFMRENVEYLREAYQGYLELKMNRTMKLLTSVTVLLSPLSLITSWYGMNFKNMVLTNQKYGYLIITIVSLLLAILAIMLFKKKKLF